MSLPESLERAASELADLSDQIRPANGDPEQLLDGLQPEQAESILVWMLGHELDAAGELVDVWGDWEKGAEILLRLSDSNLSDRGVSKAGRKILRKAHHRLRSRGIEVESKQSAAAPRKIAAVEDEFAVAHVSAPDFRGARIGYLANRHPAGGARLFEVRFDEGRGILDFKVYSAGRSKVRGFLRSLSTAQAQRLFEVPQSSLCALVRRASLAQPTDRPLPSGFVEWRGRIFSEVLEKEPTPGEMVRKEWVESDSAPSLDESLDAVIEVIRDGVVGPWPPPTSWVNDWMEKGRASVENLDGDARSAAIESWRSEAAEALHEETSGELLARHLVEFAWVRNQTDGLRAAGSLLATADALGSDEGVGLRLAEARIQSLFAPFLGELELAADEEPDATTIESD